MTAHHIEFLQVNQIGVGAQIRIVRSGEVIPKFLNVEEYGAEPIVPTNCPSCTKELVTRNKFLFCCNSSCPDQVAERIEHFFKTTGVADLFGGKTIRRLCEHGINSVSDILDITESQYSKMGFGDKQSQNLRSEVVKLMAYPLPEHLFLAGHGIHHLGKGDSKKLLKVLSLPELLSADETQISAIEGFGELTATSIANDFRILGSDVLALSTRFNLQPTQRIQTNAPMKGLSIVFTGSFPKPRKEIEDAAELLGAKVQKSVNGKTDYLVAGNNVGATKINKAESLGVMVITYNDYLSRIQTLHESEVPEEPVGCSTELLSEPTTTGTLAVESEVEDSEPSTYTPPKTETQMGFSF